MIRLDQIEKEKKKAEKKSCMWATPTEVEISVKDDQPYFHLK